MQRVCRVIEATLQQFQRRTETLQEHGEELRQALVVQRGHRLGDLDGAVVDRDSAQARIEAGLDSGRAGG